MSGEIVDLINSAARGQETVLPCADQDLKRIACRARIPDLDVNTANPMPVRFESLHQMVPNKATGARYQYSLLFRISAVS